MNQPDCIFCILHFGSGRTLTCSIIGKFDRFIRRSENKSGSMASLYLFVFLGIICSSLVTAKFTTALTRVSKASLVPSTVFGVAWRSNTIDTLSLIEQGRSEEAKESLAQAALTLALLDLGGGAVLPVTEEITKFTRK